MLADEAFVSKWQQPNTPRFKDYTANDVAKSRTGSSVCLAGQGRAGGRVGSVCPSICLAGQGAGQGPSVRLFVLQGRAGRAGRAGQGPNKE
jgi:hypothetical protein